MKVEVVRTVRDLTKIDGCRTRYKRSNGYFKADEFSGDEWQFGRELFDTQVMIARMEKGEMPTTEELKNALINYCGVMNRAAYLRASYDTAMQILEGKAEFVDDM